MFEYTVKIEEVTGGVKVTVTAGLSSHEAFAAQIHQVPQRVKDLFEGYYPKPEKKA